jgi:hypothetical protein
MNSAVPRPSLLAVPGASERMTNTRCPVPVAGLLEHGQGLAQIAACIVVRSRGLGGQTELEVCVRFPAWVAERLRKGQCLPEMVGGPFVLAQFIVQNADRDLAGFLVKTGLSARGAAAATGVPLCAPG